MSDGSIYESQRIETLKVFFFYTECMIQDIITVRGEMIMKKKTIIAAVSIAMLTGCTGGAGTAGSGGSTPGVSSLARPALISTDLNVTSTVTPSLASYTVASDFSNITNQYAIKWLRDDIKAKLAEDCFVVVEDHDYEFFDTYEYNKYEYIANFVTVDSMMHTFHLYYAYLQKKLEQNGFYQKMTSMSEKMLAASQAQYEALKGTEWESAAMRNVSYFQVGLTLLGGNAGSLSAEASAELELIDKAATGVPSVLLSTEEFPYLQDYTQFIVRGYYNENELLQRYFKGMMWYGQMNFTQREEDLDRSALLMVLALNGEALADWQAVYTATAFFSGESDDSGYYEYLPVIQAAYGEDVSTESLAGNEKGFAKYHELTGKMSPPKVNSVMVNENDDRDAATLGYRLMGQRFTIDAGIMQRLVFREVEENEKKERRMLPSALDVPAALGSDVALSILESEGATSYKNYTENMNTLREQLSTSDSSMWNASIYSAWLNTLRPLLKEKGEGYPTFMQGEKWAKKNLVSFLGSYAELKHDSILYAKQVMAEMGGGGGPEPADDRGYVEPEPEVFGRLAAMANGTVEGLKSLGLISDEDAEYMGLLSQLSDKLKVISEKELRGELPNEEEFELIRTYGDQIKHLWIKTVERDGYKGSYKSMDFPAAIVADIATDPYGTCLEIGTGNPATIYVAVYFDGAVHLTSGKVFTFYQFEQPTSNRLTDEEWRDSFKWGKEYPREPEWVYDFTQFYNN